MSVVPTGVNRIERLFETHLEAGLHHGAQLAVYHEGDLVVDLAGGVTGSDGEETTVDTRHLLFSCTKPYAGACVHRLVEAGELDYDDRLVDHWPTFAEDGTEKAAVTVRHVLSHQAGLPVVAVDADPSSWGDPDALAASVEDAELAFSPGETAAYHALSDGWLVGELVRRVSGTRIGEYAAAEVFEPLGMERTGIGLDDDEPDEVATLVGFEPFDRCREPNAGLDTLTNEQAAMTFNTEAVHRAVAPAANGIGTAREMARFYACLAAGGTLDGTRLLAEETVAEATSLQHEVAVEETLGVPRRYALGFALGGTVPDRYGSAGSTEAFGHGGLGSSIGWADPDADLAFSYVTNGIRDSYEHSARVAAMADTVRLVLG